MCGSSECIHEYNNTEKEAIECAGTQVLYIEGEGILRTNAERHNGLQEIQDVKYVPNLTANLLSVSKMTKGGHAVVFVDNHCGVYRKGDVALKGKPLLETKEFNGTYKVNLEVSTHHSALKTSTIAAEPWHERLGHLGKNSMDLMTKLVDGMSPELSKKETCVPCLKAKQTKGSFPKGEARRASEILEIVHSDVCETSDGLSREGFKYFVTFIDDKTRYTYIGLLKQKSEVFDKFREYKSKVERHTGKHIKYLRSDNGGEYVSDRFKQYFKNEGIVNQFSVAGNPEQNGVAERANRTILEKARAMLKNSGLENKYWPLAVNTAVYLKNLSPTKALENMVPYEAWTGERPNIKNLKVFGCLCFGHIDAGKTKKLKDRTKACIFVSYDSDRKTYRLMDLESKAISSQRYEDVTFNETIFSSKSYSG